MCKIGTITAWRIKKKNRNVYREANRSVLLGFNWKHSYYNLVMC